jgi:hypothetical protein
MLTRVLRGVRLDTIDKRSQVGVAIRRVYDDLVNQLGGPDVVTPAEALLLEEVAKKAVIVRAVGEYVLRQELPVRDGRLFEVVLQHDRLQTSLAALLDRVGFQRRAKDALDVAGVLAQYHEPAGPVMKAEPSQRA